MKDDFKEKVSKQVYVPHGWTVNMAAHNSIYTAGVDFTQPSRFAQECARKKQEAEPAIKL